MAIHRLSRIGFPLLALALITGSFGAPGDGQGQTTGTTGAPPPTTGTTGAPPTTGTTGAPPATGTTGGEAPPVQIPPPATTGVAVPPIPGNPAATVAPDGAAKAVEASGQPYGYDFFASARAMVDQRRSGKGGDALTTAVGPEAFMGGSVAASTPERYQLGPGDKIVVTISSPFMTPSDRQITIDPRGYVRTEGLNAPVQARGRTVAQLESALRQAFSETVRNVSVSVSLNELRSIGVQILGESYAPGAYLMPATVTLFNALYASGGPSRVGSMRRIQLKRANEPTREFDLYRLLLKGEGSQDVSLQPGDVIFIPPASGNVRISGEVVRAATYELKPGERLKDALYLAGGVLPSGIARKVAVTSVRPGTERLLLDVDSTGKGLLANPVLYAGDEVDVYAIRTELANVASIEGAVQTPRGYAVRPKMTIRDLVTSARGLLPDAYAERADLFRLNPDGSTTLLRIDLRQALKGDPSQDVPIRANDRLVVYRLDDVRFSGARRVTTVGALRRPGAFDRADGMTLADLILRSGGLAPDAYLDRAYLRRTNPDGTPGPLVPVDLAAVVKGVPSANIVLQDLDEFRVYTVTEATFQADRNVDLAGAVQRPGRFPLSQGLTLKDLVEQAGGTTPTASVERVYVQRMNADGTPGPLVTVDLRRALAGDPAANLALSPADRVTIYTAAEASALPALTVEITGAVQRPVPYPLAEGMKLSDLIRLAGGPLADADRTTVYVQRANPDGTQGPLLTLDLEKALAGDPANDIALQSRDRVSIFTKKESSFRIDEVVRISGAVQRPGVFPRSSNMKLSDLLKLAGGIIPTAAAKIQIAHAFQSIGTPPETLNTIDVIAGRTDPVLQPGDVISLPIRSEVREQPLIVFLNGAVKYPGPYIIDGRTMRISDVIERAGGLTFEAFPRGAQFARLPALLQNDQQRQLSPRILEALRLVSDDEYKRASALADMDRLRVVFSNGASISGGNSSVIPQLTGSGGGGTTVLGSQQGLTPGVSLDQALAQALRTEAATKARPFGANDLIPVGNLGVRMENALHHPRSADDVVLKDGDVITIPEVPTSVTVAGAVVVPSAVVFDPGKGIDYYLQRSGGITNDSDTKAIVIVRASGELVRYRPGIKIELGDTVIVPTKVMAVRLAEKQSQIDKFTQSLTSAGITIALIKALSK